jgi:hypothetical protein
MIAGIMKIGTMLPPIADIISMTSVEKLSTCFLVLAIDAMNIPKLAHANAVDKIITMSEGISIKISSPKASQVKMNITVN